MTSSQILLLVIGGGLFLVIALIIAIGDGGSLKSFKNKPVVMASTARRGLPPKMK